MKKALITASALGGLLAFGTPAFAADAYVAPFDWTGFYVGANAGYGWGDSDASGLYDGGVIVNGDFDPEGFVGGAQLGYNWQTDSWVLGLEADIQFSDMDDTISNPPGFDPAALASVDVDWFGTVRARAGVAFDRALFYATGGLAYGDVKYAVVDAGGTGSDTNTQLGWTAGLGAEYAVTDMITLRAEWLHVDLGKDSFSPTGTAAFRAKVDSDFELVRVGVNILFH